MLFIGIRCSRKNNQTLVDSYSTFEVIRDKNRIQGGRLLSTITKRDLARSVAGSTGSTNHVAAKMVDSLFEVMRTELVEGHRIEIRGFGVFSVKDTKPKPAARNPRTGELTPVPARRKTHFKPGRLLKAALHDQKTS